MTGGIGADLVIECSGAPSAIAGTVDLVRKKGRICAIGLTGGKTVDFPWEKAAFKVIDIHFCLSTSYTSWDRAIHLIASGQIPAREDRYPPPAAERLGTGVCRDRGSAGVEGDFASMNIMPRPMVGGSRRDHRSKVFRATTGCGFVGDSTMTIGFGILGAGMISSLHADALKNSPKARLVAVCDVQRQRAEKLAHDFAPEAKVYTALDALLADPKVDVVAVVTPNSLHTDAVRGCGQGRQARPLRKAAGHVACATPTA